MSALETARLPLQHTGIHQDVSVLNAARISRLPSTGTLKDTPPGTPPGTLKDTPLKDTPPSH
eukprot:1146990-Pelagomonas_calceolata.AAC.1